MANWQSIGVFGVTQNAIYGSLVIAVVMILASIADMTTSHPFGGNVTPDIIFLFAAAAVAWMAIDCLKGTRKKK